MIHASRYCGFRGHENGSHPAELRLSGLLLIRRETSNLAARTPSFQVSDLLVYQALTTPEGISKVGVRIGDNFRRNRVLETPTDGNDSFGYSAHSRWLSSRFHVSQSHWRALGTNGRSFKAGRLTTVAITGYVKRTAGLDGQSM